MAKREGTIVTSLTWPGGPVRAAVEAKAREALRLWRDQPDSVGEELKKKAFLAHLPLETLHAVLTFLDYHSLLMFRETGAWAYALVHDVEKGLLASKLACAQLGKGGTVATLGDGIESALRLSFTKSMQDNARTIDDEKLLELQKLIDVSELIQEDFDQEGYGIQAFASIRVFPVPRAICVLGENLSSIVAKGMAGATTSIPPPKQSPWINMEGDAWSDGAPLTIGTTLRLLHSNRELAKLTQERSKSIIIEEDEEADSTVSVNVHSFVNALQDIVDSQEIMVWHDSQYKAKGHGGQKLLVVGFGHAAVVQWDVCSNFCGGPYACYDCGMG